MAIKKILLWSCDLCSLKTTMGVEGKPQGWKRIQVGVESQEKTICGGCVYKVRVDGGEGKILEIPEKREELQEVGVKLRLVGRESA